MIEEREEQTEIVEPKIPAPAVKVLSGSPIDAAMMIKRYGVRTFYTPNIEIEEYLLSLGYSTAPESVCDAGIECKGDALLSGRYLIIFATPASMAGFEYVAHEFDYSVYRKL